MRPGFDRGMGQPISDSRAGKGEVVGRSLEVDGEAPHCGCWSRMRLDAIVMPATSQVRKRL